MMLKRRLAALSPWLLLASAGCLSPPVETPTTQVTQATTVKVAQSVQNKVDILFMIDNSSSMKPKQDQLKAEFPELIKVLQMFGDTKPASYHIGVVTSDLGANSFTDSAKSCHAGGDGGRLQIRGAAAASTCMNVTGGVNYIDYNQLDGSDNLPPGQDIQTTFSCMATVGATGCGFEHQLESPFKALTDNTITENAGFLRDDALLAVVWVTDEDDCSGDPASDVFDSSQSSLAAPPMGLGALASYRCNKWGVVCDDPTTGTPTLMPYAASGGNLANCRPATMEDNPAGKMTDMSRYIDLFTKPKAQGGIKIDPADVILAAISADPAGGIESILGDPDPTHNDSSGQPAACSALGTNCQVMVKHSCVLPTNHDFFGDPAVRIKNLIDQGKNNVFKSICDIGDYAAALSAVANLIITNLPAGCLGAPLTDPVNPQCEVEDVQALGDGTNAVTEIFSCGSTGGVTPCWAVKQNDQCPIVQSPVTMGPEQVGVTLDRGGASPPPNTSLKVSCLTIAVPATPASN